MTTRKAFTVVELIIAASVIGIIASVITANLSESRARARDANRIETVSNYNAALEQWKASNGNYFVYMRGGTIPSCTFDPQGNGYMSCTGAAAVGFYGSGAGGITRKKESVVSATPANYTVNSIADALVTSGYLSRVRLDPKETSFHTNTTEASGYSDFILTLCKANSAPADSIKNAQEFAIFTLLERPGATTQSIAETHCGGAKSPSGGWNTLIAR